MNLNEADTRAKLIDPAIHKRGWTEELIRREQTPGAVEIINGKGRRRSRGKIDYVLRVKVNLVSNDKFTFFSQSRAVQFQLPVDRMVILDRVGFVCGQNVQYMHQYACSFNVF